MLYIVSVKATGVKTPAINDFVRHERCQPTSATAIAAAVAAAAVPTAQQ